MRILTLSVAAAFACSGPLAAQTLPADWAWFRAGNTGVAGEEHAFLTSDPAGNVWTCGRSILFASEGSVVRMDSDGVFTCWSDFEGYLPGSRVTGAAPSGDGTVWVGTDAGLARGDGNVWTHYTTTNSPLPSHHIRSVALAPSGLLWCAFYETNMNIGGIASFDGTVWTVYTPSNSGLPDHTCRKVLPGLNGEVWVVTDLAVTRFYQGAWDVYDWNNSPIAGWGITEATVDDEGQLHVVTGGWAPSETVAVHDGTGWSTIGPAEAPWQAGVTLLDVFHRGGKSIYTASGPQGLGVITVESDGTWAFHPAGDILFDVHIDAAGRFLVAGMSSVSLLTDTGWKDFTRYNAGLAEDLSQNILIDSANRFWAANGNGGAQVFDCPRWESYGPLNQGLFPSPQTLSTVGSALCEDSYGNVWFAFNSTSGAAVKIPGGNYADYAAWEVFDGTNSPLSWVEDCVADGFGNVFFYSDYGTHMWNGETATWTTWDLTNSPLQYYTEGFGKDASGKAYFGGFQQIAVYDGATTDAPWSILILSDIGAPSLTAVNDIAFGPDGAMWLATPEGISRYSAGTWTTFTPSNSGLVALHMNGIELGPDGTAYACGYDAAGFISGGVSILPVGESSWTPLTVANSYLPSEQLDDLALDGLGNLWINAYPRGIAVYRPGGVEGFACIDRTLDTWPTVQVPEMPAAQSCSVFPNPALPGASLRVKGHGHVPTDIRLFDPVGREIARWNGPFGTEVLVPLPIDLASGLHLLAITHPDGVLATKVLVLPY